MSNKILFFLASLRSGGKERRAIELLYYLRKNTDYEILIVLTESDIHYKYIGNLKIPIIILERKVLKKDPSIFIKFFNIVKKFKPDIIHAWGEMSTFYSIPTALLLNIKLFNGQIADSTPIKKRSLFSRFIWEINWRFSDVLLSNSYAGLEAFGVSSKKGVVIHNGISTQRFRNLAPVELIKTNYQIETPLAIIMVATFNKHKDYELFFQVAFEICKLRKDVTFIAVGDGVNKDFIQKKVRIHKISPFLFTGRILNVEELINTCDIGVLFTNVNNHSEGIPNAVIEYMALSKPVIATDDGGTRELVENNISGFLVNRNLGIIVDKLINLLNDSDLRRKMGKKGHEIVEKKFSINKMSKKFMDQYNLALNR